MFKFNSYSYNSKPKRGRQLWELQIRITRRKELKIYKVQGELLLRLEIWNIFIEGVDPEYNFPGYIKHSTYIMTQR